MKTTFNKIVTIFVLLVMIFNQSAPVAALQPAAAAPTAEAAAKPAALHELGKKPAKAQINDQPPAPEAPKIAIKLSASPRFITAAGQVTIGWSIENLPVATAATLKISFPDGYIPTISSGYDTASQTLSIPVTGSGVVSGDFTLNIQTPIEDAILPTILLANAETVANAELSLPLHEKFAVKKNGSTFSAEKGRIKVNFGTKSLPEDATINIGDPAGDAVPRHSLSGHPFEIDALGSSSKKDLHQFAENVAIDVDYSSLNVNPTDENNLNLYYYDPATDDWYALPTSVDRKTKTLHATTSHFTVFDTSANDFQASHLPTLDAFQVSSFTGAATYSLPIEVPPGPGGLQPNLSLSYNSQVIDQSTAQTQASWVGMGWSLGMNSIELNDNGTNGFNVQADRSSAADDTWSINVNGVSTSIVLDSHGEYHAADENFMKFEHTIANANDTWTVWDKQGNQYFFENAVKTVFQGSGSDCGYEQTPYQWYLTRMRNTFGQELTYTYRNEIKDVAVPVWIGGHCSMTERSISMVTATYPDTITYPLGHYRIRFEREARPDYRKAWATDILYHNFQQSRLSAIVVEEDKTLSGIWGTLRKYAFEYADTRTTTWATSVDGTTHAPVWPEIIWSAGGQTSTLLRVHQYGLLGADELPTATFSYGDQMHLTRVDNGYGGKLEFYYGKNNGVDNAFYYAPHARASQTFEDDFDYGGSNSCSFGSFTPYPNPAAHTVDCIGSSLLKVMGQVINPYTLGTGKAQLSSLRPGGFYKFTFDGINKVGGTDLKYGFRIDTSPNDVLLLADDENPVFNMPATASQADVILQVLGSSSASQYVSIDNLKVELLTSVYRVETRTVWDGNGHKSVYTYDYASGAVNDDAHSDSACADTELNAKPVPTCSQYNPKYAEFRGNGQVTETDPDGHKTISIFHQDDILKGRPVSVTVKSIEGKTLSQQLTTYNYPILQMMVLLNVSTPATTSYNDGKFHYWITTATEENRIYANNGKYAATQTSYDYTDYGNYGNLQTKAEKFWNGTDWTAYRTTHFDYLPNETDTIYLTGLPIRQWVTDDVTHATLAQTLNIYRTNTTWNAQPTFANLTAVRTLVSGNNYAQISYDYDTWGNRRFTMVYKSYGTANTAPNSDDGIKQITKFDGVYRTYPIEQITPTVAAGSFSTKTTEDPIDPTTPCTFRSLSCTQIDPNGVQTTVTYDSFGRLTKVIKDGDTVASPGLEVRYNDIARPFNIELKQKVDDAHNYLIRHTYNGIGREILTETGSGDFGFVATSKVSQDYFVADGHNTTKQSIPYTDATPTLFTTTISDELNRPLTVTAPDKTAVTYSYNGLVTTVKDANDHITTSTSDVWGQTVSVVPATGPKIKYIYDTLGNLKTVVRGPNPDDDTNPANMKTLIDYDNAGHKTYMKDPDMGEWYYKYDAPGNLRAQVDANHQATNLYYDVLNRLIGKTYTANQDGSTYQVPADPTTYTIAYTYDAGTNALGHRTGMSTADTSSSWAYDRHGRVTDETKTIDSVSYTTSTTYNNVDMPVEITYPDGEKITNGYNDKIQLEKVTSPLQPLGYIKRIIYDTFGRVKDRTLGNDLTSHYDYYNWDTQGGRLQTLTTSNNLQNLTYSYDNVGNISNIVDGVSGQNQNYTYDPLDRLTHATVTSTTDLSCDNCYDENYTYNPVTGNLENKGGVTLIYDEVGKTSNHAVRFTSTAPGSAGTGNHYSYDANGNQTQRTVNGQNYDLAYDAEGHLLTVDASQNSNVGTIPTATPTSPPTATPTPTQATTSNTVTIQSDAATDGWVLESTQTSSVGGSIDSTSTTFNVGDDASNRQYRGILSFDTSTLPVGATIQSATLRIKKSAQVGANLLDTTNLIVDVANVRFGSAYSLQTGDFEATSGSDMVATIPSGSQPDANGWFSTNVNATGRGLISTTNKTQFRVRFGTGDNNNASADYLKFVSGDSASNDPELVITYTTPSTATPTAAVTATTTATPTMTATPPAVIPAAPMTAQHAVFKYDADGQMVMSKISASTSPSNQIVTTIFVSPAYQIKTDPAVNAGQAVVTKTYPGGAIRVGGVLYYTLSDHLGSTSLTTDASGAKVAETRYKAWGEVRYQSGGLLSDKTYTGQRTYTSDFGLMYYNARWYDSSTGRFAQADTIVPGGVQGLDRYAYVNNSPINYTDPSGHVPGYKKCSIAGGTYNGARCSTDEIDAATVEQRYNWFLSFSKHMGHPDWFNNILSVLKGFMDSGIGQTGTWTSWVDAGTLESIVDGWQVHAHEQLAGSETSKAALGWAKFFNTYADDPNADPNSDQFKADWAAAEKGGNYYGKDLAEKTHHILPSTTEKLFLFAGNTFYRDLMISKTSGQFYGNIGGYVGASSCRAGFIINTLCGYVGSGLGTGFGNWFTNPTLNLSNSDYGYGPVRIIVDLVYKVQIP